MARNLGDVLSGRDNALNFLRLVFASAVIVSHTWPLGGYGQETDFGGLTLGGLAVAGFFAISGYLITGSRLRLPLGRFLLNRAARIFPGFWVCLVIVAFVIAPVGCSVAGSSWDVGSALGYVWRNAALWTVQEGISGGPTGVPLPGTWNGSLWTLAYEFAAYLMTAIALSVPWVRRHLRISAAAILGGCIVLQLVVPFILAVMPVHRSVISDAPWLVTFYTSGMLVRSFDREISLSVLLPSAAVAILGIAAWSGTMRTLGALPFAIVVLLAGAALPMRVGAVNDISYGVYIYAFPVQQTLALFGLGHATWVVFLIVTTVLTLPLAWLSWHLIEHPALHLIKRTTRRFLATTEVV